jgi:hypothetical protein
MVVGLQTTGTTSHWNESNEAIEWRDATMQQLLAQLNSYGNQQQFVSLSRLAIGPNIDDDDVESADNLPILSLH